LERVAKRARAVMAERARAERARVAKRGEE
jgi:hypothetical protein